MYRTVLQVAGVEECGKGFGGTLSERTAKRYGIGIRGGGSCNNLGARIIDIVRTA
jgi:hypothetical protein